MDHPGIFFRPRFPYAFCSRCPRRMQNVEANGVRRITHSAPAPKSQEQENSTVKMTRRTTLFAATIALTLPVLSTASVKPAYAATPALVCAAIEDGVEPTDKSLIMGIKLPANALRSTS